MVASPTFHEAQPPVSPIRGGRSNYALSLLLVIYIFSMVDRTTLAIVAEPVMQGFGLKDWQIGFMAGTAFAIFYFYAALGIPIARLAERWNQVRIISIALAVWSGFTMLCSLAQSGVQLALARIGMGVGEAGGKSKRAFNAMVRTLKRHLACRRRL